MLKQLFALFAAAALPLAAPAHAAAWGIAAGQVRTYLAASAHEATATAQSGPLAGSYESANTHSTTGGVAGKILSQSGIWGFSVSHTVTTTTQADHPWSPSVLTTAGLLVGAAQTPSQLIPIPAAGLSLASSSWMTAAQMSDSFPFFLGRGEFGLQVSPTLSLGYTRVAVAGAVDGVRSGWGVGWGVAVAPGFTRRVVLSASQGPLVVRGGSGMTVSSPLIFKAIFRPVDRMTIRAGYSLPQVDGGPHPLTTRGGAFGAVSYQFSRDLSGTVGYYQGGRVCVASLGCQSVRSVAPFLPSDPQHPVSSYGRGLRLGVQYSPPNQRVALALTAHYAPAIQGSAQALGVTQLTPTGYLIGPVPTGTSEHSWGVGASMTVRF